MASAKVVNRRIHDGPRSCDERERQAVEQCITRRWNDFILSVAEETGVNFLQVLKHADAMQNYAKTTDGREQHERRT